MKLFAARSRSKTKTENQQEQKIGIIQHHRSFVHGGHFHITMNNLDDKNEELKIPITDKNKSTSNANLSPTHLQASLDTQTPRHTLRQV